MDNPNCFFHYTTHPGLFKGVKKGQYWVMESVIENRRARFDYEILETYEAGLVLTGFEAKAAKVGRMSLTGAFVVMRDNEAWLLNAAISPYQPKNTPSGYDPEQSRRLLLHRREIKELIGKTSQSGLTIIPLKVYTSHNRVKIVIGLARHKKSGDKRETIKKREAQKEIGRAVKYGA